MHLGGELGLVLLVQLVEGNAVERILARRVRIALLSANTLKQEDPEEDRYRSGMPESKTLQLLMSRSCHGQMHQSHPEENMNRAITLPPILIPAVSTNMRPHFPMVHQEHLLLYMQNMMFKYNNRYHPEDLGVYLIPYNR